MVKVKQDVKGRPLQCEIYLDETLKNNLDDLNKIVNKDWDGFGLIVGYEGDGKSVFAQQVAYYLDANFNIDNIVFNIKQFKEATENAPPNSCIVFDESDALAKNWQDTTLNELVAYAKRMRSKNLFVLFVTPTFFDMSWYFAAHRSRFMLHVYSKGLQRGFFRFFNKQRKFNLYNDGKKYKNMYLNKNKYHKPNFIGRFTKIPAGFCISEEEYNAKKDEATSEVLEANKEKNSTYAKQKYRRSVLKNFIDFCDRNNIDHDYKVYSKVLAVSNDTIYKDLNVLKE